MRSFEPVETGWQSRLEVWEREYLAGLVEQVSLVLAAEGPLEATATPAASSPPGSDRTPDDAVLASLDFEALAHAPDGRAPDEGAAPPAPLPAGVVTVLEVLLPEASEDPEVAVEVSALNRQRLRALKHSRLTEVLGEVLEPTGDGGAVLVRRGGEGRWLAALNDLRLVLAHVLGVEDADDAEGVHELARQQPSGQEDEETQVRRALATAYGVLTWWQESLLTVLLAGQGPA
ncbi:DUF2017 family protein [Actinomyces sp. W5033]|uniref:DUF2017 family protein n=1 Tax=Actinomyces sp. W5033 TaxID=3446479 RepID=UPI003EDF8BBE